MQKYQTHKRMCLASKPRANVFRQKSFKASVQREHRIQVSDQHIYFQRCLHLHEQDIYIKNKRKQKKPHLFKLHVEPHGIYVSSNVPSFKHAEFKRKLWLQVKTCPGYRPQNERICLQFLLHWQMPLNHC